MAIFGVIALAGLASAAVVFVLLHRGPIGDFALSAFFSGCLGLGVALVVARRFGGAALVARILQFALPALLAILSIMAAVVTAFA